MKKTKIREIKQQRKGEEDKFLATERGRQEGKTGIVLQIFGVPKGEKKIEENDGGADEAEYIRRCGTGRGVDRGASCVCRELVIAKLSYVFRPQPTNHCYLLFLCHLPRPLSHGQLF